MRNAPVAPARKSWRVKGGPIARKRDNGAIVARKHGIERSPEWPAVAHQHLLKEPACRACGHRGQGLQVHHIKPFHLHPDLELDPDNLITLCELKGRDHHLLLGHLDDWESYNPNVRQDVKRFYKMSDSQIRADPAWQKEERQRPFA
ncbi:MAG TPA: HNH endonuclease [Ktedonobacteraceae bacterium]|nr:HNH endonuclease [Ktedonobacteraceae bacterium]